MPKDMIREMWLGLQRFWRLRWAVKGPILGVIAFLVVGSVGAIFDDEPNDPNAPDSLAAEGTQPPASESPTPSPTPNPLMIGEPPADTTVPCKEVTIRGSAPVSAEISQGIDDDEDPTFRADDAGAWERTVVLEEGDNTFDFYLKGSTDSKASLTIAHDPSTLVPFINVVSPTDGAVLTERTITLTGQGPPGCEVRRNVSLGRDQGARIKADGSWSMAMDLDDGDNDIELFLQENKDTKATLSVVVNTKLAPIEVTVTTDSGSTFTLANERQAEVILFYRDMMRFVDPAGLNGDELEKAQASYEAGELGSYDFYRVVVGVEEAQHSLADKLLLADAPDGLGDARDELWFAVKNHGDAASHLAAFVNTGDLEELRQAEEDQVESESALVSGLGAIFIAADEAGLPFPVSDYVQCDGSVCRIVNPSG